MPIEKNISEHDKDVAQTGQYLYSDPDCLSAKTSIEAIQKNLAEMIKKNIGKKDITILDVGCGDGQSTNDLKNRIKAKYVLGIEPAAEAVKAANKKYKSKKIEFKVADAYKIRLKAKEFDIVLFRSVLHHMYYPQKAIDNCSKYGKYVLIMEPNGYSPFLKIIEKISPYHRRHEERSFFPFQVHSWVRKNGFNMVENRYINIVPTFAPGFIVKPLKKIEPFFESIPVIKHLFCAQNLTLWEKNLSE